MTRSQIVTFTVRGQTHAEMEQAASAIAEMWFGPFVPVNLDWVARQITYRLDAQLDGLIFEADVTAYVD